MLQFDEYCEWLEVPRERLGPEGRPRNHYDLLGLTPETATVERVRAAVQELFTRIRKYETSEKPGVQERVTQLRAEIAAADLCLANPNKKQEYDQAQFGRTFDLLPDAPPETVTKAAATRETVAEPQGAGAKTVQPTVVDDAATTVADATLPDATVAIVKEMEKKGAEEAVVSQPVQEETPAGSSPSAAPEVIEVEVVPEEEPRGQSVLARAFGGAVWLLLPFRQVDRLLTAIVGQENDILRWFLRIAVGAAASGAIAYFGVLPLLRLSRSASEAPTPVAKSGSGVDRGPEEDPELADDGEMTDEELASWAIEVWEAASLEAKEPSGVTWIDATREPWKCGDVTVRVRAAAIMRARLIDAEKRIADTQEDCLLLRVELTNNSPTRKIQYSSWSLRGEPPRLTDDLEKACTMQVAPIGGLFEGQQRVKSIYPENTAEDVLVFERPSDGARSLRLQLPAGAFEGSGTGYIEIPMSMVKSDLGPDFQRTMEPAQPRPKPDWTPGQGPPPLAIAPFDAEQAKEHQRRWAEHLKVPVSFKNSIGMEFVLIPPGEFLMGASDAVPDALPDERPQHRVRITKPFYLGKCEVTRGEYEPIMWPIFGRLGQRVPPRSPNGNVAMESVWWVYADRYCREIAQLSEERSSGRKYRLPTEAEWEYACRAGSAADDFPEPGMGNLDDYAWFARSGASVAPGGGSIGDPFGMPGFPGLPGMMPEDFDAALRSKRKKTSASADRPSSMRDAGSKANEVGRKRPNAFGLHDMYGNVWEMCSDWYAKDYYRRSPTENPKGADTGTHHVARGGGWSSDPAVPSPRSGLQPFHRGGIEPQGYRDFIGFRVVCDVRDGTAGQPSPQPSPPEDDDPLK